MGALVPPESPQIDPRGEQPSANDSDVTRKVADLRPLADFGAVTTEERLAEPQKALTRVPASRAAPFTFRMWIIARAVAPGVYALLRSISLPSSLLYDLEDSIIPKFISSSKTPYFYCFYGLHSATVSPAGKGRRDSTAEPSITRC